MLIKKERERERKIRDKKKEGSTNTYKRLVNRRSARQIACFI